MGVIQEKRVDSRPVAERTSYGVETVKVTNENVSQEDVVPAMETVEMPEPVAEEMAAVDDAAATEVKVEETEKKKKGGRPKKSNAKK